MNLPGLSPALKAATGLAVGAAFAGAVALTASGGHRENATFNAGTIDVTPTAFVERAATALASPATGFPTPRPTIVLPTPAPRPTIDPSADKGGLFADGVKDLPRADTKSWLTYTNSKWGYTFMYPPNWVLNEGEAGVPAVHPLQYAQVLNPVSERGTNVSGVNCNGVGCEAAPPGTLSFGVSVDTSTALCTLAPTRLADDQVVAAGASVRRCAQRTPEGGLVVQLAFSLRGGLTARALLGKGREVTADKQQIIEAILDSFRALP